MLLQEMMKELEATLNFQKGLGQVQNSTVEMKDQIKKLDDKVEGIQKQVLEVKQEMVNLAKKHE